MLVPIILGILTLTLVVGALVLYLQDQQKPAASPSQSPTPVTTASPAQSDGATLYSQNCAICHGPLAASTRRGRTATQIQAAITSVRAMRSLSNLTSTQIQAIVDALATP